MSDSDLFRAVSRVTGETVSEIRRMGFQLADPDEVSHDPEPSEPYGGVFGDAACGATLFDEGPGRFDPEDFIVDWDLVESSRFTPVYLRREDHLAVA